jgi:hypothetical protein
MIALLLSLAFWPWVLLALFLIACGFSALYQSTTVAGVALVIYGICAWMFFDVNPLMWVYENPGTTILVGVAYCALGVLWSLYRWRDRMLQPVLQEKMLAAKDQWLASTSARSDEKYTSSLYFPSAAMPSRNRDLIVSWISLWPFSMFLFIFDDLLGCLFSRLYEMIAGTYQKITDAYLP